MPSAPIRWDALSDEAKAALEQLARGGSLMLSAKAAKRLLELGLVDQKLGGVVLNDAGHLVLMRRLR